MGKAPGSSSQWGVPGGEPTGPWSMLGQNNGSISRSNEVVGKVRKGEDDEAVVSQGLLKVFLGLGMWQ
eukprot:11437684-Prorocentrum_lima.AAC.1